MVGVPLGQDRAPDPFPTRSLTDAEFHEGVVTVRHSVRAEYSWDAGEAIGRYLDGLRAGRIMGRECRRCGRVLVPPRMFCEQCFRPTDGWVEVPGTGTVNTYSICYVTWDLRRLTVPELPAVIELSSGGILHKLSEVEPADIHIGMRVEAVWRAPAERQGSILDIAHWAPLEAADTMKNRPA
ncbi:MAG TPA: Zn-ribbon domain-containing OB-fold protein [Actinomycetota bacterium]|nr:Zn-ribbon domain-containing OB-fold protein [Actinomycetota bacterium]